MRKKLSMLLIVLAVAATSLPVFAGIYGTVGGGVIVVTGKSMPSK